MFEEDSKKTYVEALGFITEGHKKRDLSMSKFPRERKYNRGCLKCKSKKEEECSSGCSERNNRKWSEEYKELNHKKSCEHIDNLIAFLKS